MEKQKDQNYYEALLKEFDVLKREIADRQKARLTILGFTIASIGTILGLTGDRLPNIGASVDYFIFMLVCFGFGILITAQMLTIHHTQWILHTAAYIRKFIEAPIEGLKYETRLEYQRQKHTHYKMTWVGASKMFALYYIFLTIAIFAIAIIAHLCCFALSIMFLILLFMGSLFTTLNLYFHFSKGWKPEWD